MRGFARALIAAIPVFVGSVSAVHAADTSCSGTLSGSITGNIVVPVGASCTLSDATVTGNVQILQNASLTVDATQQPTTINGNVLANQCAGRKGARSYGEKPASESGHPVAAIEGIDDRHRLNGGNSDKSSDARIRAPELISH